MKIALIIPCFNEEDTIKILYEALVDVAQGMSEYDFDFLFVDDGSSDHTLSILKTLSQNDDRITYISFSRNFGKEAAMYAGLNNAKGEYIAIMDADMQDPPSLLPEMIKYLETGAYDSVATCRADRNNEPLIRSMFAKLFYRIINKISDVNIVDGARDFRLMKREMVDAIIKMEEYNRFSKGIFGWVGFKTYWLPYKNVERVAGETKWDFWKLVKYSLVGIINFSQVPLAVISWSGILTTLISFVLLVFIIVRKLIFGDPVEGWASLACIIIFMGGIQLFCLGIIGQYMSKMYLEIKRRPHYIVNETNMEKIERVR